jgi:hypothetical protein
MTMHNQDEDTWFPDDAEDCVPWWRVLAGYVTAAALIGVILAMAIPDARALTNKAPPPVEDDPNEVRIGVMCGDLQGSGSVVIIDPQQQKVYKFDFTCPTGTSI